ncbi:MAG: transcriptional regulator [Anaerostipes sp.]|nr:transcriptional regulator [Anaerostipes sp.]MDD3504773.1 transcriptional regulator [Eubacteriales bacterium]MDD4371110.1 transcriptional regulator [Anaerostipes sp.]
MKQIGKNKVTDFNEMEIQNTKEHVQYAVDTERALHELQKHLALCKTPMEVALSVMEALIIFYDAEWCGILDADADLEVWTSYWWYTKDEGAMGTAQYNELEVMDYYERWIKRFKAHQPMVVTDIEDIKEAYPQEYEQYQQRNVKAIIAVPFWMRSTGFVSVKNPKRYKTQTGFIRLLTYAIVSSLNEHRMTETSKHSLVSPRIASEKDVYISLFGELKITTANGILTEKELKSPKICRLLVYLLITKKAATSPREIADAIWPEEESDTPGKNLKSLVYRFQQAFSLISEYRLIESTVNGYQINPKLNIMTDIQLFDSKWDLAVSTSLVEDKEEHLKKMVDLYEGDILQSASGEHWLMPILVNYQYRYVGAVNELIKALYEKKYCHHIHTYAAKLISIIPHSIDGYYWLIHTMNLQGHTEMARTEFRMAETHLTEDEYEELKKRLSA